MIGFLAYVEDGFRLGRKAFFHVGLKPSEHERSEDLVQLVNDLLLRLLVIDLQVEPLTDAQGVQVKSKGRAGQGAFLRLYPTTNRGIYRKTSPPTTRNVYKGKSKARAEQGAFVTKYCVMRYIQYTSSIQ